MSRPNVHPPFFDPVEKIALADLPHRAEALAFLLPKPRKPFFNNNRVEVSRAAANDLAKLFRSLVARGEDRTCAQRFILQLLVTVVRPPFFDCWVNSCPKLVSLTLCA